MHVEASTEEALTIQGVHPDYAEEDQLTTETAGDAEPLPAEEMPKTDFMVGSDSGNV